MRTFGFMFAASIAALFAVPATAQPQEVTIAPDADWEHRWTAMEFPAQFDDFKRSKIIQFQDQEADIAANFEGPLGDILSVYIYRPGFADTAIWHDRALVALGANEAFRSDGVKGKRTTTFTPKGGVAQSGIMTVLATKGRFRSTSLALYSSGEWLVKVRLSSIRLEPDGMETRIRELLEKLPEMGELAKKDAYLIEPCLGKMIYSNAERFKPTSGEANSVNLAMMGLTLDNKSAANSHSGEPKGEYCREGEGGREGSIYRIEEVKDRYLIAYGDSGTSALVAPALSVEEVLDPENNEAQKTPHFLVTYSTATANRVFMPFKSLPQPNQASQAVFREEPILTAARPFGDENSDAVPNADSTGDQCN